MRVCLLLPGLRPSGGLSVALDHAARLSERGFTVDVCVPGPRSGAEGRPYRVVTIPEARAQQYDVAIGTWWETVPALLAIDCPARVLFVQSAEERFYRRGEQLERLGAALALCQPVHFFAVARWLERLLGDLRPDASCWYVPNGIDKSLFAPPARRDAQGPLRILVEGQHNLWFKGVEAALEGVARMREPREVTLISLDPAGAPAVEGLRVLGGLDAPQMREQYAQHDVLLKLSSVESLGLPLVEACHVGVPCVVTPFTGHAEVIRHGENGLVVGFDDPDAAARALDRLAADRTELQRLSDGAVSSMEAWPAQSEAAEELARALREVSEAPPPAPALSALARWRTAAEIARVELGERDVHERELAGSVRWLEDALAEAREKAETLSEALVEAIDERDTWLRRREQQVRDLEDQLTSITESRSYRAAQAARRAAKRIRR